MTSTHVVLGATGGAGRAITRALVGAGYPTRAVSRSGRPVVEGAEPLAADVEVVERAARAVESAAVVYMAAQPPYTDWPGRFPPMLANVIDATTAVGAKLVMVDNLYGYGPVDEPMSETTPEQAVDPKGRVRREMTEMLLDAHRSGRLRVTIGRASDYYGPDCDNSGVSALAIIPAVDGKTIRWLVRDDVPHSVAYLPDVAMAYVTLGTDDRTDGQIWHVPHGPAVTGAQFLEIVRREAGRSLKTGVVTKFMLRIAAPFHAISRESLGILHQWDRPFVVDDSKFRRTFGDFEHTPVEEAVAASLRSYEVRETETNMYAP